MENSSKYLPGSFMMVCMDSMFFGKSVYFCCAGETGDAICSTYSRHISHIIRKELKEIEPSCLQMVALEVEKVSEAVRLRC